MMRTIRSPKYPFISLVFILAIAVYLPGLFGGFALDDYTNIVQNEALAADSLSWDSLSHAMFSFQAGPTMRPVSMLTFALNRYFGGDAAMGFKITNLVIHLVNGLLVFGLLRHLLQAYRKRWMQAAEPDSLEWLALLVGAAWLLHPLNLMPVLYVVQRETALSTTFVLLGANLYLWARTREQEGSPGGWIIWSVPFTTLLATFSKESGALLPAYLFVCELALLRFRGRGTSLSRPTLALYVLTLLLPACAGMAWVLKAHAGGFLSYANRDFSLGERLLSEARVVWLYIRWTLLPDISSFGLFHDDILPSRGLLQPPTTLFGILGLFGLLGMTFWLRARRPLVTFGILWFLAGQLMESTIFPLELAYEHRCYLPDLGLILAAFSLIAPPVSAPPRPWLHYARVAVLLLPLASMTAVRAWDWRDNLSFAQAEATHHPRSPYATYMLGQTYANLALFNDESQYDNAVTALRAASLVPGSSTIPDVSLILVEAQLRGPVEAGVLERIGYKLATQRVNASDLQAIAALVDCINHDNCHLPRDSVERVFTRALSNPYLDGMSGAHADILVNYGNFTSIQYPDGKPKARALMAEAAALVPAEPQYRANLVTMDIGMDDAVQARQDLDALRKLNYLGHLDAEIATLQSRIDGMGPAH